VQRFDSALRIYERIFSEYPTSKLADSALFRVAVNAEKSYDYDKAIEKYQKLVKDYPQAKDRENALYNTARLLEALQRYNEAAAAFLRFADAYPKSEEAPKNQFVAASSTRRPSDWNKQIGALNEFVQKFSKDTKQTELVVEAKKRIGDAYDKLNKDKTPSSRGSPPPTSSTAAGSSLRRAPSVQRPLRTAASSSLNRSSRDFDKMKIGGSGKALENSLKNKKESVKKVNAAYERVSSSTSEPSGRSRPSTARATRSSASRRRCSRRPCLPR
jgi:TolA-binding protein